jgi:hypothetical protein
MTFKVPALMKIYYHVVQWVVLTHQRYMWPPTLYNKIGGSAFILNIGTHYQTTL